jgi:hypothetical protein
MEAQAILKDAARLESMSAAALEFCRQHRGAAARHRDTALRLLTAPARR